MNIKLSYDSSKPMYEQVKDGIKAEIFCGNLRNLDALPSIRLLARDLNVSMITTKRAYEDLEREGFVTSVPGKGTFVKVSNLDNIVKQRENELLLEFADSVKKCFEADIKKEKIVEEINKIYDEKDRK